MKEIWTKSWKEVLIWFCGYVNLIAFAVVGGYAIVKSDDEALKKTAKTAFIVTLIFTALSALITIYNYCGSFADNYYGSAAYDFYSYATKIVEIARIIVYAVFIILTFVKNKKNAAQQPEQSAEETAEQQ